MEENTRLREECATLVAEKEALTEGVRKAKEQVAELEQKLRMASLKEGFLAGSGENEASKKRAQQQINRLMREIDRCIALMNR